MCVTSRLTVFLSFVRSFVFFLVQALREDNTAEARAVKRQKYLGKFKTAGASQPSTVSNGNSTATPNKAGSALAATTKV